MVEFRAVLRASVSPAGVTAVILAKCLAETAVDRIELIGAS